DTNGQSDVFVHDFETGQTKIVSVSSDGQQQSGGSLIESSSISSDGQFIVFRGPSGLDPANKRDAGVYIHDLQSSQTILLPVYQDPETNVYPSQGANISGDGRAIVFVM